MDTGYPPFSRESGVESTASTDFQARLDMMKTAQQNIDALTAWLEHLRQARQEEAAKSEAARPFIDEEYGEAISSGAEELALARETYAFALLEFADAVAEAVESDEIGYDDAVAMLARFGMKYIGEKAGIYEDFTSKFTPGTDVVVHIIGERSQRGVLTENAVLVPKSFGTRHFGPTMRVEMVGNTMSDIEYVLVQRSDDGEITSPEIVIRSQPQQADT